MKPIRRAGEFRINKKSRRLTHRVGRISSSLGYRCPLGTRPNFGNKGDASPKDRSDMEFPECRNKKTAELRNYSTQLAQINQHRTYAVYFSLDVISHPRGKRPTSGGARHNKATAGERADIDFSRSQRPVEATTKIRNKST